MFFFKQRTANPTPKSEDILVKYYHRLAKQRIVKRQENSLKTKTGLLNGYICSFHLYGSE